MLHFECFVRTEQKFIGEYLDRYVYVCLGVSDLVREGRGNMVLEQ